MTITAAADGSALGNPGPAGWAWYIDDNHWHAGGWPRGTNNMGELKAVLDLLESTAADPASADQELLVLCDSQYVINSVTKWMPGWKRKGWKKRDGKPVLNVELMQALDEAMQGRRVRFEWVKGHAGHPLNEAADRRANAAATAFRNHQAPDEGPGLSEAIHTPSTPAAPDVPDNSGTSDTDEIAARECALFSDAVRSDRDRAESLLHPKMTETDQTGHYRSRREVVETLAPLIGFDAIDDLCPANITVEQISPNVFLTTFSTEGAAGTVARTSIWVREGEQWTLRHHQATPRTT